MKNIGVICGGYSSEYDISIKSASTILENLPEAYNGIKIILSPSGWHVEMNNSRGVFNLNTGNIEFPNQTPLSLDGAIVYIHGNPGENGKVQALLDMLDIPYVNANVLSSALSFDKWYCNQFLKSFDFPVAKAMVLRKGDSINEQELIEALGLPLFVKPTDSQLAIAADGVIVSPTTIVRVLDETTVAPKSTENTTAAIEATTSSAVETSTSAVAAAKKPVAKTPTAAPSTTQVVTSTTHAHTLTAAQAAAAASGWPRAYDPAAPIDFSGIGGVTAEQAARATALIQATQRDLPKYAQVSAAMADGYTTIGDGGTGFEHYVKWTLLNDGRVLVSHIERALGRTAQNAIPETRMRDKFRSCARRVLRDEAVEPLLAVIDGFEAAPNVAPLMSLLMPSTEH